jgi:hypothetical protein
MPGASSIQHKASVKNEAGFAFEDGERVPITEAEIHTDDPPADGRPSGLTIEQFANVILIGNPSLAKIGERFLLWAYKAQLGAFAPKTLRELGGRLGCSHVAAGDRLNRLQAEIAGELPDF